MPESELKKDSNLFFIYSNLVTKKIKYESTKIINENKNVKSIKLIPEVKIKTNQLKKTKNV